MGRVAGGEVIYGRGILAEGCPDFLKEEMSCSSLTYLSMSRVKTDRLDVLADISLLSVKSKYYLRLMEVCARDKFTSIRQDSIALSSLIREICETYKEDNLKKHYLILLGKGLTLESLSTTVLPGETERNARDIELKTHIENTKNYIVHLLIRMPIIVEEDKSTLQI